MKKTEIEKLIKKQREFFETGATIDTDLRLSKLTLLYEALENREADLLSALYSDLGKSGAEGYMCELGLVKHEISFMKKHLRRFARERKVPAGISLFPARCFERPVPYGNVLIMSPWNYPLLLSLLPLVDALAAGNTAILKPGAYAAATSEVLGKLIADTFPEEYVAVVTGGRAENTALLDCRFDMIFFTGGKTVGQEVLRKAARYITPTVLELGGKSPVIVDETADIALAARRIVFGKFVNAGQTCVAPDYVCCRKEAADSLTAAIKREIARQLGSDPLRNPDYGKIINKAHFDRLSALIDEAGNHTGVSVYGGEKDEVSLKIAPTLIEGATKDLKLMREEIFGPVLPILSYDDFEACARAIAESESPLAFYIFSSNRKHIDYCLSRVPFGGGCVNDTLMHLATSEMGFGGVGESGMGAYHGRTGFFTFSHTKSIADRKTFFDPPLRYRPYRPFYAKLVRLFLR